jgi:uncharacterized protein YciI
MFYLVAGYLKPGAEERLIDVQDDFNEHLAQSEIVVAGALRNEVRKRVGYLAVIDAVDLDDAQTFLSESPLSLGDFYERTEVLEFDLEVGRLV